MSEPQKASIDFICNLMFRITEKTWEEKKEEEGEEEYEEEGRRKKRRKNRSRPGRIRTDGGREGLGHRCRSKSAQVNRCRGLRGWRVSWLWIRVVGRGVSGVPLHRKPSVVWDLKGHVYIKLKIKN